MNQRIPHHHLWLLEKPVIGMIHLLPLPGSPRWLGSMRDVVDRALADLDALLGGGVDGVLIENFGDAPFHPGTVAAETVAAMSVVAAEVVRSATDTRVGVNVLRNDAASALAVAAAAGCAFIRVNVHTGSMLTDQGWISGMAHDTLRMRARLGTVVAILADVMVKHAVPPPGLDIMTIARDTWERGLADGLIVTGPATGLATDPRRLRVVREAVPEAPLWVGSGATADDARALLAVADGIIAGSALQRDGIAGRGVERDRVVAFMKAARTSPD